MIAYAKKGTERTGGRGTTGGGNMTGEGKVLAETRKIPDWELQINVPQSSVAFFSLLLLLRLNSLEESKP